MSKVLRIGLDFDGVIVDHTANKIKVAKALGVEVTAEQTPSDTLKALMGLELFRRLQKMIYDDPAYALTVSLVPGALAGLEKLKTAGREYFLISRQKDPKIAAQSLRNHGLWDRYFTEENVFFVPDTAGKDKKAAELGVGIYLDDQASVLKGLTVARRYLLDPLNVYPADDNYRKVLSWEGFLREVDCG